MSSFIFGDFISSNREYTKIENNDIVVTKLNDYLVMHNANNPSKIMNLVFFNDAIVHLSRICRVLMQPRGNALLIGVGGSGRQSLTRISAHIRGYETFQIEISKTYNVASWKEDLKKLLFKCGAKNIP